MTERPAVDAALTEADQWIDLVANWREFHDIGVEPSERATVGFFDPSSDVRRRMAEWGFEAGDLSLTDLALFAAGLARAEADAWTQNNEHIATRAYMERRFLLSDRILHWAVPWLRTMERVEPIKALASQLALLGFGERHRPAPLLADGEGLTAPGEDSYGPLESDASLRERLLSVWSGQVLGGSQRAAAESGEIASGLADSYRTAAEHWHRLAETYAGSARLWRDLGRRSERTSEELAAGPLFGGKVPPPAGGG